MMTGGGVFHTVAMEGADRCGAQSLRGDRNLEACELIGECGLRSWLGKPDGGVALRVVQARESVCLWFVTAWGSRAPGWRYDLLYHSIHLAGNLGCWVYCTCPVQEQF